MRIACHSEAHALSIEPAFSSSWGFAGINGGLTANNTLPLGDNRLNLQDGVSWIAVPTFETDDSGTIRQTGYTGALGVPIGVGFDLVKSEEVVWRFTGNADLVGLADTPAGLVAFSWNKALAQRFRLALGAGAHVGENPLAGLPGGFFDDIDLLILPLPTIELWWKF